MENVRIAILSNMDKVCAFMDNEAVDGLHYWDDELHRYLSGSTNTFSFKADATHEDSIYLIVGNKISFRYKMRDYYFNIVSSVRDEDVVEVEAFALIFELLNEYSSEYTAAKAMTFAEYIDAFDYEKTLTLGINEVSDKSIKHEWTGTNTILARLFSLANVFSAEIEILPQLNMDYSLNSLILNVYREHSEQYQGIGANRVDKILRYGVEVEGITKTSDVTELYTSIKPIGKDGLTLVGMSKIEVDENGEQEYVLLDHDGIIRAVQARDRFPSNIMGKRNDGYILRNWSYETENVNMLYGQALAQLKKDCVPQVSYDVKGYFDLGIGDTVVVCDEEYNPELYLSVRVVEQSISFTDPSNNKSTVGNVRELQSELDPEILERVYMLEAAVGAADNKYATKDNLEETNKNVTNVTNKVSNLENVVAGKVSTEELEAQVARIATLETNNATINSKLTANEASINSLVAKNAEIDGKLTVQDASIKKLDAEKLSAEDANLTYATIESLKATDAKITNLSGDYASFKDTTTETLKAQTADIIDLKANKLSAEDADFRYANIDFTNIGKAAMEYFYAQSGLIKDVTVGDQTITGELVGVTIKGNLIEGETITADKLVVKGEDGLYYKLNINALGETTVKADEKYQNGLDGSVLIKKSIVAEKISVKDLVAFGATIGGVNIADSSVYSGVKSSVNNTTRGFYLGKDGQVAFGDASNYLKYFQDTDGTWKLAISADSMSLKSGTSVDDAISDINNRMDQIAEEVTTSLYISSSKGNVFKNTNVSTYLSITIIRGTQRITDSQTMKSVFGENAYLQWRYQGKDDEDFWDIPQEDPRILENGFKFKVSPSDIYTKGVYTCDLIS
ncbi:phage tail protein [uncultured Eubacterium sp.]|uniref:phage tail protein n=1 Tax=uncultured Eubacterium sp. TaxID=165185 RepID=UPI0025D0BA1A|nr:phage tail protein [uncultured Eubacterium sp.]